MEQELTYTSVHISCQAKPQSSQQLIPKYSLYLQAWLRKTNFVTIYMMCNPVTRLGKNSYCLTPLVFFNFTLLSPSSFHVLSYRFSMFFFFVVSQYLDKVEVEMRTCEEPRPPNGQSPIAVASGQRLNLLPVFSQCAF